MAATPGVVSDTIQIGDASNTAVQIRASSTITGPKMPGGPKDAGGGSDLVFRWNTSYGNADVTLPRAVSPSDGSLGAAAGEIGEYIETSLRSSLATGMTSGTVYNVLSINLTPGDWHITGHATFITSAVTFTGELQAAFSATSATMP